MSLQLLAPEHGIFLVKSSRTVRLIPCHTYLITAENSAVLIDPGPEEDFAEIYSSVTAQIGCEKIENIILTSELPEGASSLALWEHAGFRGRVVVSWQSYIAARYYAPNMDFHSLTGFTTTCAVGKNRVLEFLPVPGFPTAGSVACWDKSSGTLFSGKLFGAITGGTEELESGKLELISSYHDIYFTSSFPEHLGEMLLDLNPARICPQHGDPLDSGETGIRDILIRLGSTGRRVNPDSAELQRSRIIHKIFQQLTTLFSPKETAFAEKLLPPESEATEQGPFSAFFSAILDSRGYTWLALIDAELRRLCKSAGIDLPDIYKNHETEIQSGLGVLVRELKSLRETNFQLQHSIIKASDDLIRDSVTGLYNEKFFGEYICSTFESGISASDSVLVIRLDSLKNLNSRFGAEAGDLTLKALASFLMNRKTESGALFRLNGPAFIWYLHNTDRTEAEEYARELQQQVEIAGEFIAPISVSAALLGMDELIVANTPKEKIFTELMKTFKQRIKTLDRMGPGSICSSTGIARYRNMSGSIMLIESSYFEARIIIQILETEGFEVQHVALGADAVSEADRIRPDAIISEMYVTQMDGFQIRKNLLATQDLKNIPFILVSREKSEVSIRRAHEMQILHFFRKPLIPAELTGTLYALIAERNRNQ